MARDGNRVYKVGLFLKRATWLVEWLRLLARTGKTEAKAFAQGLGRLGFASILGAAFFGTATRLVLGGSGEAWTPDATDHGQGAMWVAS